MPKQITTIRLPKKLKEKAIAQGINLSLLTEKAIILELAEKGEAPFTKSSYQKAVAIAEKYKLTCHFDLIKEIAIALDNAGFLLQNPEARR